jgi:hypothetical protein
MGFFDEQQDINEDDDDEVKTTKFYFIVDENTLSDMPKKRRLYTLGSQSDLTVAHFRYIYRNRDERTRRAILDIWLPRGMIPFLPNTEVMKPINYLAKPITAD